MIHARKDYERIQDPEKKIPDDEPVFLVRAQDPAAPAAVEAWAAENDRIGGERALSDSARAHAQKMREWPVRKVADGPRAAASAATPPPIVVKAGVAEISGGSPGISTESFKSS